jgi:hypothetical protein
MENRKAKQALLVGLVLVGRRRIQGKSIGG